METADNITKVVEVGWLTNQAPAATHWKMMVSGGQPQPVLHLSTSMQPVYLQQPRTKTNSTSPQLTICLHAQDTNERAQLLCEPAFALLLPVCSINACWTSVVCRTATAPHLQFLKFCCCRQLRSTSAYPPSYSDAILALAFAAAFSLLAMAKISPNMG